MSWTINSKALKGSPATTDSILIQEAEGTVKRTTAGNASGNIPLSNGAKCVNLYSEKTLDVSMSFYASGDALDILLANFTTADKGAEYFLGGVCTNLPLPSTATYMTAEGSTANMKVYAKIRGTKASYTRNLVNSTWEASWTQLTDSSGNAVFPAVATTASAANAYIGANGTTILKSTSSKRYKTDIRDLDDSSTLDQLRPVLYKSNPDTVPGDDQTLDHYGFIAEDIDEIDEKLVQYKEDESGEKIPDGVQYDRITVLLVKRIHELEARLAKAGI